MARYRVSPEEQKERRAIYEKAYYLKNRETIREQQKTYGLNNKEAKRIGNKKYFNTEQGRLCFKKAHKRQRDGLADCYIKTVITTKANKLGFKIKRSDITPEMVELQRESIQIKRIEKSYTS